MTTLLYFILFIGPLIFVHELGHFLFAKLFDVKVHKFSLGFGPRAVGFRKGETEYVVAWVPLGGYVKMLGEDPDDEIRPEDQGRAFNQKPLWQRYIVVLAGPAFNLIFPIIIYFVFFASHTHLPPAVVGRVLLNRPAAEAGLKPEDRIVAIDGNEVRYWTSMQHLIADKPGIQLRFTIERDGKQFDRYITPREEVVTDRLQSVKRQGQIGISPFINLAQIGITSSKSAAARAGLKTGDLVTSVNGKAIKRWDQLEKVLKKNRGQSMRVAYLRPGPSISQMIDLHLLSPKATVVDPEARLVDGRTVFDSGINSGEFFVRSIEKNSPMERIGMSVGSRVIRFNKKPIHNWDQITHQLYTCKDPTKTTHSITWVPLDGKPVTRQFKLSKVIFEDDYRQKQERHVFGAHNYRIEESAELVPIRGRFTYALVNAVRETGNIIGTMALVVVKIFRGSIPRDTIGGPIMLAITAKAAAEKGWDHFLFMLALISINLGILNLLPIPVLDGGHILFFTIEAAKRKPLSLRAREIASYIGLVLILSLLIFAFKNDIFRYWWPK